MKEAVDSCEHEASMETCAVCAATECAWVSCLARPAVQWVGLGVVVVLLGVLIQRVLARGKPRGGRGRSGGRSRGGDSGCIEIYVGNLSYDMTEAQLRREFEKYGTVKSARIIENRYNKKSKGFGFVEMPLRPEAEAAVKALHDKDVMGRKMRVNEAKNKSRE